MLPPKTKEEEEGRASCREATEREVAVREREDSAADRDRVREKESREKCAGVEEEEEEAASEIAPPTAPIASRAMTDDQLKNTARSEEGEAEEMGQKQKG